MLKLLQIVVLICCCWTTCAWAQKRDATEVLRQLLAMPAPPPTLVEAPAENNPVKRPESFFDKKTPPPDDAPIEDLLEYWSRLLNSPDRAEPSSTVKQRLFDATAGDLDHLIKFLPLLTGSETIAAKVKELFNRIESDPEQETPGKAIKEWLVLTTKYYMDELIAGASKVQDDLKGGSIDHNQELIALARLDWPTAEPLLQSLIARAGQRTSTLAITLLYKNSITTKDARNEEKYRLRLQTIAADRGAAGRARDDAIEALLISEWSGRDDWYLSLFNDETLISVHDGSYGMAPLDTLLFLHPDKWIPIMTKMVGSNNRAIQQTAASCLVRYATSYPRRDAILPVLRWLTEPEWLQIIDTERAWFIQKMDDLDMPESVPGLIWIVENDESNAGWAARTLAHYKDPRAVPALKKALARASENDRIYILDGLFASGGVTESEAVDALEAYAANLTTVETSPPRYLSHEDQLPIPLSIGRYLALKEDLPPALVRATLARVASLHKTNEPVAKSLLQITQQWQNRQIDLDMIQRIGSGTADAATIANALNRRMKLRESSGVELRTLLSSDSVSEAISSVLLGDKVLAQTVLSSGDQSAQIALLAAARLVQMRLTIEQVGELLRSKNSLLALAAERYLLAEDSKEAHTLLWQQHPGEAFIAGWRETYDYRGNFAELENLEKSLRAELFKENGPSEIIAVIINDDWTRVLRIYGDRATYTHTEDRARYREMAVSKAAVATLKQFVASEGVAERGPEIGYCHHTCVQAEFLTLTKEAGQRVYARSEGAPFWNLEQGFDALGSTGVVKLHYKLEDQIKGARVLYAGEDPIIKDVWLQGDEILVFVERKETEEETEERTKLYETVDVDDEAAEAEVDRKDAALQKRRFSWRKLIDEKLGEVTTQPAGYSTIDVSKFSLEPVDEQLINNNTKQVQMLSFNSIIIARNFEGLWKQVAGGTAVRIGLENKGYSTPIVSPGSKWVVVARSDDWTKPYYIVRHNVETGRELRVNLEPASDSSPIAFIPTQGKVLLRRAKGEDAGPQNSVGPDRPEYYLLDPNTGETKLVSGDFRPLLQESRRLLQATDKPEEFWAAIPDEKKDQTQVGRYNFKTFSFTAVLTIPSINFESASMWVDEKHDKIYVAYNSQLLSIPLKPEQ